MLVESLLLAVASGLLGIAVAAWGVDVLVSLAPAELPRFEQITLDARALAFTLLASVVVGLVFGSWPALRVSRPEPVRALRGSGRATGARDERRAMQVLVGVELAIAQVLLVAGGLLLASFGRLVAIEPGFDPRGVLVAEVSMPAAKAANPGRKAQFIVGVLDRLAILPGVDQVASTLTPPMSPSINRGYRIPGRPEPERRDDGGTAFRTVSNDFFALLAIRVVRGRAFDRTDSAGSEPVAVVNEAFVRRAFRGADPIGQHVTLHNLPRRIVGVVADTRQVALSRPAEPEVYVPVSQDGEPWNSVSFLVRTQGSPSALAESVRQAVLAVDAEQPLSRVETLEQAMATSLATRRFTLTLTAVFAGIALLLAAIGTFGVMSHAVAQRTRDLGIRIALGATPNQVLAYALRGSAWLTLAAVGVGLVGGGLVGRAIRGLLYQVGPANTLTLAGSGLVLATVAMLASYVPVRRAIAADPVRSLRVD
jgi:predicted permease